MLQHGMLSFLQIPFFLWQFPTSLNASQNEKALCKGTVKNSSRSVADKWIFWFVTWKRSSLFPKDQPKWIYLCASPAKEVDEDFLIHRVTWLVLQYLPLTLCCGAPVTWHVIWVSWDDPWLHKEQKNSSSFHGDHH